MAELLLTMYFNEEYFFMDSLELVILHKKRNSDIISDNPLFKMCTITDKGGT